jgi:hypothetical protein
MSSVLHRSTNRTIPPTRERINHATSFNLQGLKRRGVITAERAKIMRTNLESGAITIQWSVLDEIDVLLENHPSPSRASRRTDHRESSLRAINDSW